MPHHTVVSTDLVNHHRAAFDELRKARPRTAHCLKTGGPTR